MNVEMKETGLGYAAERPGYVRPRAGNDPRPRPPPRRPKGRFFFALVLTAVTAFLGYQVYASFFRFRAHGVVLARHREVGATAEGRIAMVSVAEGSEVRQGQVLMAIDDTALVDGAENFRHELAIARADLAAETVRMRWQAAYYIDLHYRALGEYRTLWAEFVEAERRAAEEAVLARRAERREGDSDIPELVERDELEAEIHSQETRLAQIEDQLRRARRLTATGAIQEQDPELLEISRIGEAKKVEELRNAIQELVRRVDLARASLGEDRVVTDVRREGWEKKTDRLREALDVLRERTEAIDGYLASGSDLLQPFHRRIEAIETELAQLERKSHEYRVESPVDGTVLRVRRQTGERSRRDEPPITILEAGSAEVVLYLHQDDGNALSEGDEIDLEVEPDETAVRCRVTRIGGELEPGPDSIEKHYRAGEALVPVHLAAAEGSPALRPGAVVHWRRQFALPAWLEFLR